MFSFIIIFWFAAQETFLIIVDVIVENSCAASYFCRNWYIFLLIESSKEQHLFEMAIFCTL